MSGDVLVSLLESVVLLDIVEIVSSDDDGSLHLGRNNDTPKYIIIINIYLKHWFHGSLLSSLLNKYLL